MEGVKQDLLCRFRYFGVPDEVDYRTIPWRNSRFDEEELTRHVATQSRARNALEQLDKRGGTRTLAPIPSGSNSSPDRFCPPGPASYRRASSVSRRS